MTYDLSAVRARFPALSLRDDGRERIYLDNPAGTQVPQSVVDAMSDCLLRRNANLGGPFATSIEAGRVVDAAHAAMADLLNARSSREVIFGQNMTSLTFHISRSLGRRLRPGDEIVLSRMDHDANVTPWMLLARDMGLTVRWLDFDTEACEFDLARLDDVLNARTRLVCVGYASNLLGTVNDVRAIATRAREAGALSYIDAVHYVPHGPVDVQAIGCDLLVCSAYKFFGPHQGIVWGREELLDELEPYKLRPAPQALPGRFETGTQSHEGLAGTTAAVEYLAWIGATMAAGADMPFEGRRRHAHAGLECIRAYEATLAAHLVAGLKANERVTIHGISDPGAMGRRVPTVSFTMDGMHPQAISEALGERNIFTWSGHSYAIEPTKALGLLDSGGVLRVGLAHYNSADEIDRLLTALSELR